MKLEPKHIIAYLDHKLMVGYEGYVKEVHGFMDEEVYLDYNGIGTDMSGKELDEIKPLLLPLSALTEPLEDGSVPIVELAKAAWTNNEPLINKYFISNDILKYKFDGDEYYFSFDKSCGFSFCRMTPHQTFMPINNQIKLFEYLFANHFDIYGLIDAGLAIDKRTLTLKQNGEKFKVGDTVRLITGLVVGEMYDGYTFFEGMKFTEGIVGEVTDISCLIGIFYYPFSILERVDPC